VRPWAAALVVLLLGTACSSGNDRFAAATPGRLCVATALPAPGFWEDGGGFERQLAGALADRLSLTGVRVVNVPLQELAGGVPAGCDVGLSQLVATPSRRERAAWTSGYLRADLGVVTVPGRKVPDLRAAKGLVWAVEQGSTGAAVVAAALPDARVLALPGVGATLEAVRAGRAQAAALDLPLALVATADRPGLTVSARFARGDEYAVQVRSGRPHEQVDQALRSLVADGTVDRLEQRWLTDRYRQNPNDVPVLVTEDLPLDLP
jgi:ABC-type amino acid transport substrate-binding protein